MFIHRKLTTTCCVAVLALGLVACGSSDDDTSMTDPTTMDPMELAAAEQLANAQAAVADAKTMVAALAADSSPSDRAAAYAALAGAQSVLAEASGIPENEIALLRAEIARLHGDIDKAKLDAQAEADRIAAEVETEKARLQGDIDKAKLDAQAEADRIAAEMETEKARVAALVAGTKEAETKRKAIGAESGIAGLGGIADVGDDVNVWTLDISRDRMATTVKIVDPNNESEDDPQFAQVMDFGDGRTMHTRTMVADGNVVTEVVIVSTDIDAPKATAFTMVDGQALNFPDTTGTDDDPVAFTILAIDGDDDAVRALLVKSSAFTAGTVATLTFTNNDPLTDDMDEAFETAGTYNGAMGTYRCNSGTDDCTVTLDAKGVIAAMSAGWIFTPAMGATSDVPDADHLRYGFWLQKTVDEDGVLTYDEVQTFAGSSVDGDVAGSGNVAMVTGSATYNGGATGVYVHSEVNSDGSRVGTTAGQFAADATLTATFGQVDNDAGEGTIAENLLNKVTGSISNFELENDEKQQWSVNLKGGIDSAAGTVSAGTADGGGTDGSFSATFHGPTGDDNVQPSSVVGEFDANFNNGSVAGAFGARK